MLVEIRRKKETSLSVTGEMWIDGQFECYTLEPSRLTPVHPGHPCIPAGRYKVILTLSPHLGYVCPEVLDVPGRTKIRWHIANFPKDLEGCVGVGLGVTTDAVTESKKAFERLMALLRNYATNIEAVYTDPS
jgi:hypothetical protein